MPCIFCEIVAQRALAKIVYQDESVTAFRDLHPRAPTHILIVPNIHIESLDEVDDEKSAAYAGECLRVAQELAKKEGLRGGYRLVTNVGPDTGQSVFHLHFHLLGGRRMAWPPG
jgi:histidine triad (HIT) family protein